MQSNPCPQFHIPLRLVSRYFPQAYPDLYHAVCDINYGIENEEDKFKVIYGAEMSIVNNDNDLIYNLRDKYTLDIISRAEDDIDQVEFSTQTIDMEQALREFEEKYNKGGK